MNRQPGMVIAAFALVAVAAVGVMVWVGISNFPIYHLLMELVGIIISASIFTMGWNTRSFTDHDFFSVMGCGYLGMAFLDFLHVLTHKDMPFFPSVNPNLTILFWLAARSIVVVAFLHAVYVREHRLQVNHEPVLLSYVSGTLGVALLVVLYSSYLEPWLIPAWDMPWQIAWRFGLIGTMFFGFWRIYRLELIAEKTVTLHILGIIVSKLLGEVAFLLQHDLSDQFALVGHLFKVLARIFAYRVLVVSTLRDPYHTLFYDLNDAILFMRAQRHDMLNDLTLASTYLQMDRPREAQQCIEVIAADLSDRYNYTTLPKDAWYQIITAKSRTARARGVTFRYKVAAPMPNDFDQRRLLPKLVANLLDNALDAAVEVENPWISLEWTKSRMGNVLRITNSGHQIPEELKSRLFEPGLSTKGSDRGFGLTICRKIANELGAQLTVESNANSTSFILTIPDRAPVSSKQPG